MAEYIRQLDYDTVPLEVYQAAAVAELDVNHWTLLRRQETARLAAAGPHVVQHKIKENGEVKPLEPHPPWNEARVALENDGWRQGPRDGLWRNDRFGGAYKTENALIRIESKDGEITRSSFPKAGLELPYYGE